MVSWLRDLWIRIRFKLRLRWLARSLYHTEMLFVWGTGPLTDPVAVKVGDDTFALVFLHEREVGVLVHQYANPFATAYLVNYCARVSRTVVRGFFDWDDTQPPIEGRRVTTLRLLPRPGGRSA